MKHFFTWILLHTLLTGFGQAGLKITEYMPKPGQTHGISGPENAAWLEISNLGNLPAEAGNYKLRVSGHENSQTISLRNQTIFPGQIVLFYLSNSGQANLPEVPVEIITGAENLYLLNKDGVAEDSLLPTNPIKYNEIWVRNAISGQWSIFPEHFATPGDLNPVHSNWNKLASTISLPAADSEPNACLTYKGKIWILGGWKLKEDNQTYGSSAYVWNSEDGVNWTKISDSLPFTHYSRFIVYKDSMWVYTNYNIYCSADGIQWDIHGTVPYEFFGSTSRLTVLNDKIYFVDTSVCGYSNNGIDFTFQNHTIPPRNYGELKAMNGKLYFLGGQNIQTEAYYNDVWVSEDGLNWNQLTEHAPWKARKWFMSEIYQHKIWIFGGFNLQGGQFDGFANMNDIWFSEDGAHWHPYTPNNPWPIRHAAYHTLKDNQVYMIAGFDNEEINGLYNDVWTFQITNYYLKPGGDINNRNDWSSSMTLDGPGPENFDSELINYHIRSSSAVLIDKPFAITNPTTTIVVGDGISETSMELLPQGNYNVKTIVLPGSTLIVKNFQPEFQIIPQPKSHIAFSDCPKLKMPLVAYSNLTIENSRIIQPDTLNINGHFSYNQLNLSGANQPDITVYLNGALSMGERTGPGLLRIIGMNTGDQEIFTWKHTEQKVGNTELIKPSGNFILRDPLYIDNQLKIGKTSD